MIALLVSLAFGDEVVVAAKPTEVVVFLSGARVTRSATAEVPAGRSDLVFEGLPLGLVPASLVAEGEGTAGAILTGIDFRPKRATDDRDARVAALRAERLRFTDRMRARDDEIVRIKGELGFLAALEPRANPKLEDRTFLATDVATELVTLSRAVGADTGRLLVEQRAAERANRDDAKEVARIDKEIGQLSSGDGEDSLRVAVGVDAQRAGRVTVRLKYLVDSGGWTPHYDARYRPADGKVRLELQGEVVQQTGEDWQDVALTLSTAMPQEGTAPPALDPFWLGQGSGVVGTSGSGRAAAIELPVRGREDVPSDGTRHRVGLTSWDLSAELVHRVVPRKVPSAWLTARVTNPDDHAWLAGGVSAYMGTAYVGEGALAQTPPGKTLDLSFGVDERVRVERTRVSTSEGDKPLANREHAAYAWKTTITNRTGRAVKLVVSEQIPVSREQAFVVKAETTPEVTIPSTGLFDWELSLADGAKQELQLRYDVSWPQGDRPVLME